MTLSVDASAIVAMLAGEPGHRDLERRLEAADRVIYSPIALWEAVTALCRSYKAEPGAARAQVADFIATFGLELTPIDTPDLQFALDAYETYGKGRHRARLNMGDCFAYACAKANGAALLYRGDDFVHTDLA